MKKNFHFSLVHEFLKTRLQGRFLAVSSYADHSLVLNGNCLETVLLICGADWDLYLLRRIWRNRILFARNVCLHVGVVRLVPLFKRVHLKELVTDDIREYHFGRVSSVFFMWCNRFRIIQPPLSACMAF